MHVPFGSLFVAACTPVLEIVVLCSVGALTARQGILTVEGRRVLSTLTYNVFSPCLFLTTLGTGSGIGGAMHLWPLPINVVMSCLIGVGLGTIVAKLVKPPPELASVVILANAIGNTVNIPLVMVAALGSNPRLPSLYGTTQLGLQYVVVSNLLGSFMQFPISSWLLRDPDADAKATKAREAKAALTTDKDSARDDESGSEGTKEEAPEEGPEQASALMALPGTEPDSTHSRLGSATTSSKQQGGKVGGQGTLVRGHSSGSSSSSDNEQEGALNLSFSSSLLHHRHPHPLGHTQHDHHHAHEHDHPQLHRDDSALASTGKVVTLMGSSSHPDLARGWQTSSDTAATGRSTPDSLAMPSWAVTVGTAGSILAPHGQTAAAQGDTAGSGQQQQEGQGGAAGLALEMRPLLASVEAGAKSGPSSHSTSSHSSTGQPQGVLRGWKAQAKVLGARMSAAHATATARYQRLPEGVRHVVDSVASPPMAASILGLLISSIPPVQDAFFGKGAPLQLLTAALEMLGAMCIPTLMLVLGSNLQRGPGVSRMPARCTIITLVTRLLVAPVVGMALVMGVRAMGLLDGIQPIGIIVMLVCHSTPTATIVHTLATMYGRGADDLAAILFYAYPASILTLPPLIALYLMILS